MNARTAFDLGLLAGVLLMTGGQAVYWFVGGHPPAGPVRTALVVVQLLVGLGGGLTILLGRPRESTRT